ncbi:MAG TPA: nucleotidyltransferase domain-containing protein [Methylomusa anaerophila]|uniref:Nucleotidyltransferase domain protein n=1 Tax=Methylomusa anaerophila TaxID=1930071 RepID=A0A348AKB8_9FIRM|nr:nucleotidyltransferase domain-containing protein [Methylomusa anaerophila]BBB91516.1 nucleotidyltransferase domain protein [Methylomusa anaerophila]HML89894.1 nucleotidyltransferase domain-containing protein [Methylomusa anaerophila]HML89897.1 nucleotidyltransferase domain-containing protein [Methylomusa anaerophila]
MPIAKDKKDYVNKIMDEIVGSMRRIFGDDLRQVILFGSYARGEEEVYSDMDVMVLVNLRDAELCKYNNVLAEVMTDISVKYGVLPAIIDKNYEQFYHWLPVLPFYRNVKNEGIEFYAS